MDIKSMNSQHQDVDFTLRLMSTMLASDVLEDVADFLRS